MQNTTPKLVVATTNPGKLREITRAMEATAFESIGLADVGADLTTPEETGATFHDNARIKAVSYARQTGLPCLADDSGLEVDALDGAPGVISSHFATAGLETGIPRAERDAANNAHLLDALAGTPAEQRSARFVCVMIVADPDGAILHTARGTFDGRIGEPPRVPSGEHGFGYDPLFLVGPYFEQTSAEISPDEKNARSHRGHALRSIMEQLSPR